MFFCFVLALVEWWTSMGSLYEWFDHGPSYNSEISQFFTVQLKIAQLTCSQHLFVFIMFMDILHATTFWLILKERRKTRLDFVSGIFNAASQYLVITSPTWQSILSGWRQQALIKLWQAFLLTSHRPFVLRKRVFSVTFVVKPGIHGHIYISFI